uniref:MutS protein homolog 5 n=1 Tax=Cyprinodon variegatus TaxID=28743 RepID=A0A3Q2CPE0_CYPVA
MVDTPDNQKLHLLSRIQEVRPHVIITSAKQEGCLTQFLQKLLEVGKQRLLSAYLPFLPACTSERDKLSYLSSCITFDSPLMLRAVGALLKCLDRRRVGVELEDSTIGVPILHFHAYTFVLQIFKSDLHPSVYKLQSGEKEGLSLYILNRCRSRFGSKLLQWFMRPTQDLAVLHRRQEVICFFTSPRNSDVLNTLQASLRNIRNIPMTHSNTKVTDWQHLYKTVYSAACIRDSVRHLPQSIQLFREISEKLSDDLNYIAALLKRVVDFDASLEENRFTVKPNVDSAIDEKRRMMGLSDFLTDVARRELEQLDSRISSCCVIYIPLIGFLLSVPRLPSMVEKEDFEMEGLEFMFLSEDRLHYRSQRTRELDNLLGDLHCDIRLDLMAELDCLMAMSSASQEYCYTSPKLTRHRKIAITQGHPLLELCSPVFVANSFQSFESESRIKIITGPNSSGKSIFLKQVGLIVFMALIGSNVPAKEAEIGLVDGIFTRMQSRESISVGLSSFMVDLNQMALALNSSSGNSLVLIDEFGKGTNTLQADGLSLLAASVSFWLQKSAVDVPHILLATNFHSLMQLGLLPTTGMLSFLTLETAVDRDELVFLYQLKEGICQSSYAANIAALAGLVSEHYRTGKPIKHIDQESSGDRDKCQSVVEKFLSLELEDKDVDLQSFMKDELLPSAGE